MKLFLLPIAAMALIGAGEATENPDVAEKADELARLAVELPEGVELSLSDPRECRDKIEQARAANGQSPLFDREPASPDNPLAIYAVDRRQDGCSAMVMMGNPGDIRPLPERAEGPPFQRIPAETASDQ